MLKTGSFDYELNPDRIAQQPVSPRGASRLLVLIRATGQLEYSRFEELDHHLRPGDVVVVNNSRVMPGRVLGRKIDTGGQVEILLLEQADEARWLVMVGGKRVRQGLKIRLHDSQGQPTEFVAEVTAVLEGPVREVRFEPALGSTIEQLGTVPLPPYIHEKLDDPERYQTVYSQPLGSAAAPTAGLHFTTEQLLSLRETGVQLETVTLHVGLDTFKPVDVEFVSEHPIHSEWASLSVASAKRINEAKLAGGRLIAVGTTVVRVLETAALRSAGIGGSLADISARDAAGETANICPWRPVAAFEGRTDLFIYPGYRFRAVDSMVTNFHLPRSSLLMLVSAFAGREQILSSYQVAIEQAYRFYSFGDAMLIL